MIVSTLAMPDPSATFIDAALEALFVVGIAELFDKTWFITLIVALKHGWKVTLFGSYMALLLHTVLSAGFGWFFSMLARPYILHFGTAALFFLFFILYIWDAYNADPDSDLIASGKEEEEAEMLDARDEKDYGTKEKSGEKCEKDEPGLMVWLTRLLTRKTTSGALQTFIAVFIAEWGDRTQIAMIGLHASLPIWPVFLGSAIALLLVCVSAVIFAEFLSNVSVSERTVMTIAALSFLASGALSFNDFLHDLGYPCFDTGLPEGSENAGRMLASFYLRAPANR
jgi:putative Ca2+/H+ antiporter (TMEM165/GDT1 family)